MIQRNNGNYDAPQLGDVAKAIWSANAQPGTYGSTMKSISDDRNASYDRQIKRQSDVLSVMKDLSTQGNADAEAVDKAISRFAGDDPVAYEKMLRELHNDPEPVSRMNAVTKAAMVASRLGIRKPEPTVLGYGSRVIDKNTGKILVQDNVDPAIGYGRGKAPSGYEYALDENGEKTLKPIPGGPADPATRTNNIKPPPGYQVVIDDAGNSSLAAIPGGPADKLSPEASAKRELLVQGVNDIEDYKKMIFTKDGNINRDIVFHAALGTPFTEGRKARSLIMNAIEAKLRAESGAAVPEQEVVRMAQRFVPSSGDKDDTIRSKTDRLEQFLKGTLNTIDYTRSKKNANKVDQNERPPLSSFER